MLKYAIPPEIQLNAPSDLAKSTFPDSETKNIIQLPEPSNGMVNSPNLNDDLLLTDTGGQFNLPLDFEPTNSKANLEKTESSCADEGYNVQPPDILMPTP